MDYEVRALRTRCLTGDRNSGARTYERSFLYLLTAFDPSDQEALRQTVHKRAAWVTTMQPITKNPSEAAADSHII